MKIEFIKKGGTEAESRQSGRMAHYYQRALRKEVVRYSRKIKKRIKIEKIAAWRYGKSPYDTPRSLKRRLANTRRRESKRKIDGEIIPTNKTRGAGAPHLWHNKQSEDMKTLWFKRKWAKSMLAASRSDETKAESRRAFAAHIQQQVIELQDKIHLSLKWISKYKDRREQHKADVVINGPRSLDHAKRKYLQSPDGLPWPGPISYDDTAK